LQVLPWLFYHKALGVETYFLFVEGKAALPNSTAVLESIPGVKLVPRTKELEDQQAKRWAGPDMLRLGSPFPESCKPSVESDSDARYCLFSVF
jgi:hypothetical protein